MRMSRAALGLLCLLPGCASTLFDPDPEIIAAEAARNAPTAAPAAEQPAILAPLTIPPVAPADLPPEQSVTPPISTNLWERLRDGFAIDAMADHPRVAQATRRYTRDKLLELTARRSAPLLQYVIDEVARRGLPMELALVPFVESGYSLEAISQAEAHGAWQFIPQTARTYALNIDPFHDQRRSLIASTRAALDYLEDLHRRFGDWPLAFAAYNCGEKRVQAEIDRARARGRKQPGFNDLPLPEETRDYVPRIFALKQLIGNPQAHRAMLPELVDIEPLQIVAIERDIDIDLLARLSGISEKEFRDWNPDLMTPALVGRVRTEILLPRKPASQLKQALDKHPGPFVSWRIERLPRAMTLAEAARHYRVAPGPLRRANPLAPGQRYAAGNLLLLPVEQTKVAVLEGTRP